MEYSKRKGINCPILGESSLCCYRECQFDKNGAFCPQMTRYGRYETLKGEIVQRYICLKSYRTFSMYTNDKKKSFMHNRNLPCADIVRDREEAPYTLALLSKKYNISVSTIRSILKKYKK